MQTDRGGMLFELNRSGVKASPKGSSGLRVQGRGVAISTTSSTVLGFRGRRNSTACQRHSGAEGECLPGDSGRQTAAM